MYIYTNISVADSRRCCWIGPRLRQRRSEKEGHAAAAADSRTPGEEAGAKRPLTVRCAALCRPAVVAAKAVQRNTQNIFDYDTGGREDDGSIEDVNTRNIFDDDTGGSEDDGGIEDVAASASYYDTKLKLARMQLASCKEDAGGREDAAAKHHRL